jgi:hypothetical protein
MFAHINESAARALEFLVGCAFGTAALINLLAGLLGAWGAAPGRRRFVAAFLGFWVGVVVTLGFGWFAVAQNGGPLLLLSPLPGAVAAYWVARRVGRPAPPPAP